MRVYLVRHGSAAPGADDRVRPLTPQGRREVEATAGTLAARGIAVAEIRHSGLVRARETSEILERQLAPPRGVHEATGLLPEDDPAVVAAELERAAEPLMLVGHLPHLARLGAALVPGPMLERVQFAPGTAVGLRRAPDGWHVELIVPERPGGAR